MASRVAGSAAPDSDTDAPNASSGWVRVATHFGPTLVWNRNACFSHARRELQGDELLYTQREVQVQALLDEARDKAENDPAYAAGVEKWRRCMSENGFDYAGPEAPARALGTAYREGKLTLDELRLREVEIATADAKCYRAADLAALGAAARDRTEREVAGENRNVLEDFRRMRDRMLAQARRLTQSI